MNTRRTPSAMPEEDNAKHHIYDERFRSMATRMDGFDQSFISLRAEMKEGFANIFAALDRKNSEPMRFGKEFFSLLALGVGGLWFVITLLVNPITKTQEAQTEKLYKTKNYIQSQIPLLDHQAQVNRDSIVEIGDSILRLQQSEAQMLEWKGETRTRLQWLRDDIDSQKEDLRIHHPTFTKP